MEIALLFYHGNVAVAGLVVACLAVFCVDIDHVALYGATLVFDCVISVAAQRIVLDVDLCSLREDGPVCSNSTAFCAGRAGSGALAVGAVLELLRTVESDLALYGLAGGLRCRCGCSLRLRCSCICSLRLGCCCICCLRLGLRRRSICVLGLCLACKRLLYVIAVICLVPAVGCDSDNVYGIALKDVLDLSVICAGALSDVNGSCCIYGYIKLGF